MSKSQEPKPLGLRPDQPIPADADGKLMLSRGHQRLLKMLSQNPWLRHPSYRDITMDHYLGLMAHGLYNVPGEVLDLVADELADQKNRRVYEPSVKYLTALSQAAIDAGGEVQEEVARHPRSRQPAVLVPRKRLRPRLAD